ncbi:MAG TPA: hypothetical protein VM165_19450 [Planctomycetaceae bacterium]|nr:hypothetical protein [Planctomycetaceae bacterium]
MNLCIAALLIGSMLPGQLNPTTSPLIRLEQAPPRGKLQAKLPAAATLGPVIPGLRQGAVPQGLAYWKRQNWLFISCYFENDRPSVITAVDVKTGNLARCVTLLDPTGKPHDGHVGGLAISDKYLWVGSGAVFRLPLDDLRAAEPVARLRLLDRFRAESTASFLGCHERQLWVGEFVLEDEIKGRPAHHLRDRNGADKYAWITGYKLNADDDLVIPPGEAEPIPSAVLSIRQKVQGMAVDDDRIVLSVSYGRDNNSTLAVYKNPLKTERAAPHRTVKVGQSTVPLWFLDGRNRIREADYAPMSEGIAFVNDRLAVITESGAAKYQKGGKAPIDNVIYLSRPDAR